MRFGIEKQYYMIEKENLGLVFCNGYRFYNNDLNQTKLYQYNFVSDRKLDFETELRSDHIGSTSIPLMRKTCLAKTGLFDIGESFCLDHESCVIGNGIPVYDNCVKYVSCV